ncbi:MAG: 3-isopropylmalate dehydrogenase [Planctomycetota bacterium]|jgi:3-isopropylmalate dehydrogenase
MTTDLPHFEAYKIAVLAGDGIGPEVMDAAQEVLNRLMSVLQPREGRLDLRFCPVAAGAGEFLRCGDALPTATIDACIAADAVLLGAMGLPSVRRPCGRELTPQIDLRERFELYRGERPVRLYHPSDSPLKSVSPGGIDFVILRESTEGLFSSRLQPGPFSADEVCDTLKVTRRGSLRLFHDAFKLARCRRRLVTLVDKANVLPSMVYFRRLFDEVAEQYPDVRTERVYVDAAALFLVRRPETFDVLVTENMFGDILSDLAAALVGGMGMAPSADVGPEVAVFQPCHGTAPDIAGLGIANPVAMILSAGMMLDWLGTPLCSAAAARLRRAVEAVLEDPSARTPDLGGKLTTAQLTRLIVQAVG